MHPTIIGFGNLYVDYQECKDVYIARLVLHLAYLTRLRYDAWRYVYTE